MIGTSLLATACLLACFLCPGQVLPTCHRKQTWRRDASHCPVLLLTVAPAVGPSLPLVLAAGLLKDSHLLDFHASLSSLIIKHQPQAPKQKIFTHIQSTNQQLPQPNHQPPWIPSRAPLTTSPVRLHPALKPFHNTITDHPPQTRSRAPATRLPRRPTRRSPRTPTLALATGKPQSFSFFTQQ